MSRRPHAHATARQPLPPSATHRHLCRAQNGLGSTSNYTHFRTSDSVPSSPGTPYAANVTNTSITWAWTVPKAHGQIVSSYDFEFCTSNVSCVTESSVLASSLVTLSPGILTYTPSVVYGPGVSVTATAFASNSLGAGPPSGLGSALTANRPDTPAAPSAGPGIPGLSASSALQVVWSAPNSYGVPILEYEFRKDATTVYSVVGWQTQYIMADLVPGVQYSFDVRAKNAYGWSDWSSAASILTSTSAPDTPALPTFSFSNGSEPLLTIFVSTASDGGSPITHYYLQGGVGANGFSSYLNITDIGVNTSCNRRNES